MIVASMSVAFADSDYKITVTNSNTNISIAGKTYTAYKLFDAVYSGNNASYTIKKNSKFFTDNAAKTILDKYFDFTTASGDDTIMVVTVKEAKQNATTKTLSDADVRALADELKAVLSGKDGISATVAAGAETVDIDVGAAGFYIVDGTAAAAEEGSTDNQGVVAAVALTNAKPTATVNPKADAPSIDKKITGIADGEEKVYTNGKLGNGSVGDKVEYQLDSKVPTMTGYTTYQFVVTDTMSKGLTFNDDIAIKIDNVDYTAFTKTAETNATTGITTITITFTNFIAQKDNAGKDIVITYSATINENAYVTGHEDNAVYLEYSNNPYDEKAGTPDEVLGKTPDHTTDVYVTNIELTKVDSEGNKLVGAKFKIEGNSSKVNILNERIFKEDATGTFYRLKDGTYTETPSTEATASKYESTTVTYKETTVVNKTSAAVEGYTNEGWVTSNSTLTFNGLGEGTYTITELVAPDGYNLLKDPISVVISFDKDTKTFSAKVDSKDATIEGNTIKFNVVNNAGSTLPSTGGMGTTILYIGGSILVLAAAILLITKRRMNAED